MGLGAERSRSSGGKVHIVACGVLLSCGHPFIALTWALPSRQPLVESKPREVLAAWLTF